MREASVGRHWAVTAAVSICLVAGMAGPAASDRLDGVNVIMTSSHPFGSAAARHSLAAARRIGARVAAIVPFLWQPSPASGDIARGGDMTDAMLRAGIRDAHANGLAAMVKPHVWVPQRWAGAVEPAAEPDWREWFARYRHELVRIAAIAKEEGAEALAIGTELLRTTQRPEWFSVIEAARAAYPGLLLYVAHNVDEAERVPFWERLDAIGVSLYPPLGADGDRAARRAVMQRNAERLDAIAARTGKPVVVAEIGLRSARGAAEKPWESAEERAANPDALLQAEVLADWLAALHRPAVQGVLVWRWLTDPAAGGLLDTDFTVQGKPAEGVLMCAWTSACATRRD